MASYLIVNGLPNSSGTNERRLARESTGRLWALYDRRVGLIDRIFASYSDDIGEHWTEEAVVTEPGDWGNGTLAVDYNDNLHILYTNVGGWRNLYYRKRTLAGWSPPEVVVASVPPAGQYYPSIAVDSLNNLHACWWGNGWGAFPLNYQILHRVKTPAGWQPVELVTDMPGAYSQLTAQLAVDKWNNIHIIWYGQGWGANPGWFQIVYRKKAGGIWQAPELVTDMLGAYSQGTASLCVKEDNVHVAWTGQGWGANPAITNVQYRERTSAGWQPQEAITDKAQNQYRAMIAIDGNDVITIVWEGYGWDFPARLQLRARQKTTTWQGHIALTDSNHHHQYPGLLWATFPNTNSPLSGYAALYQSDTENLGINGYYAFFKSAVLTFTKPPVGIALNKAYALAREEL
jgi:hypothetical protein